MVTLVIYLLTIADKAPLSQPLTIGSFVYVLASLTSFGAMCDRRPWAAAFECARLAATACLAYFMYAGEARLIPPALASTGFATEFAIGLAAINVASLLFIVARSVFTKQFFGPAGDLEKYNPRAIKAVEAAKKKQ